MSGEQERAEATRRLRAAEALLAEAEREAGPLPPWVMSATEAHMAVLREQAEGEA